MVLRLRNTGDIVEEYHVDVVGDPALWCVIEPSSVRLYPGTTSTVRLTFSPPRSPDSAAGPHPFGVRVTPVENPEAVMVPEGNLTVTPFVDVHAELLPPTVRGWRRAKPRLVVDNYGNTTATAAVVGSSSGNRIDFDVRTPSIQVSPGRAHFSVLRLRPERLLWLGQKVSHPFTTTLQLSGAEPVSVPGTYLQSALLPRWMARLFALLLALLGVFVAIWFTINPSVASDTTQEAGSSSTATVSVSPSASASPSASPSATASPSALATTQVAAAATSTAPATMPSPVAWWKLNDDSTDNIAADQEGGNPDTLTNVSWCTTAAPWDGDCAVFDGTASAVSQHNALNTAPGSSFTVSALVDLYTDKSGDIETMVSQDSTVSGGSSGFYLQYLGNQGGTWAFSRPGTRCAATNSPVKTNWWTTLIGVYDSTSQQLSIYVDGVKENTCTLSSGYPATVSGGSAVIGRAQTGGSDADWFTGILSDVQLYDVALTGPQISALMKADYNT